MKMLHQQARLLCLLATLISLSACSAFEPREGDGDGEQSTWQPPNVPTVVFANLDSGLEELTGINFTRSLHEDFTFSPLPGDSLNPSLPGKFLSWTREVEEAVVERMLGTADTIDVQFTERVQIRDEIGRADFELRYLLTIVSNNVPPETTVYSGRAQFDMVEGTRGWELIKWRDTEADFGVATWGFLRGTLRQ